MLPAPPPIRPSRPPVNPNERERDLARWVHGDSAETVRLAALLAHYREELLRPFDEMRTDYTALGDVRVSDDLSRLLVTSRGHT